MAEPQKPIPVGEESIDFVICDNTLNRKGWSLRVEGIDFSSFQLNPVCVLQHETRKLSIGKWKNLRVEDGRFLGALEFDASDDEAVTLYWKYKKGYMNAVSLNILPVEESSAPEDIQEGQAYSTVMKSELLEISCVTVPGNGNAVKLSYVDGKEYKLSLTGDGESNKTKMADEKQQELEKQLAESRQLNADNLVALHVQRGVVGDEEVVAMKKLALGDYATTKEVLESRKVPEAPAGGGADDSAVLSMVKTHLDRGAIGADQKGYFETQAKLDFAGTSKMLTGLPGKAQLDSFVQRAQGGAGGPQGGAAGGSDRSNWSYLDYCKKDSKALGLMQKEEPEKYKALELAFVNEAKDNPAVFGGLEDEA